MMNAGHTHSTEPVTRTKTDSSQSIAPHLLERNAAEHEARDSVNTQRPLLGPAPQGLHDNQSLAGFGRPLPVTLRQQEERRLGADLSAVRLHDDLPAQQALQENSARAFTRGSDIALQPEDARFNTAESADLLRHELAHAVQQSQPGSSAQIQREDGEDTGLGRSPPEAAFTTMDSRGSEDEHTLFDHDSAALSPAARATLAAMVEGRSGDLVVHVHGYTSLEGADEYNRNLSAHRAVAVRNALLPMLPSSTRFVLYAHGETDVFGEPDSNRRVGIDVIAPEDGSFLGAPGPLSLFPRRPRISLFHPGELDLGQRTPAALGTPVIPHPSELTAGQLGIDPGNAPGPRVAEETGGFSPDPAPNESLLLPESPPSLFQNEYSFSGISPNFSLRGVPMTDTFAASINAHYIQWRLRFLRMGMSPEQAEDVAQFATDFAVNNQLSLEAPTQFEQFDRRFGTEPPPTITIINESRVRAIIDFFKDRNK